ncbi:PH domain-containing protein [Chloropicon primus]|uniref:PH domain-containing protein n=1 Tax=Chloropicon primus TaxID=1764295 RepID=A0A5B8MRH2_9CHLO|nr:hypothetical protein A3770_07p47630 [Chloropicon primus]UPR01463.1 PH domain-containing protein [Chloropicon primus]|eukprot:QDZ22245.1 hypothetical protein A3770_07p47630 [Chloropicon primus]
MQASGEPSNVNVFYPPVIHPDQPNAWANHPDEVKFWVCPDHQGSLLSQAKFLKDWRKRWWVLKSGFLFKFHEEDVTPTSKYSIAIALKDCLEISCPIRDESRGPTLQLIIKQGYKPDGLQPDIQTLNLVANSKQERNTWLGKLLGAKSQGQSNMPAMGVPNGAGQVYQQHAVDLYGESIASELAKLRVDVDDIKKGVNTMNEKVVDPPMPSAPFGQYNVADDGYDDDDYGYGLPDDDDLDSADSLSYDRSYDQHDQPPPPPPPSAAPPAFQVAPYTPHADRCVGVQNTMLDETWVFDPNNHCGKRIRVRWLPDEKRLQACGKQQSTSRDQWWAGVVTTYNPSLNLHRIQYDDNEVECLNLSLRNTWHEFESFGPKDVGRRVEVYWAYEQRHYLLSSLKGTNTRWCNNPDGKWYGGVLTECRRHRFLSPPYPAYEDTSRHNKFVSDACVIKYDDGDVELVDLRHCEFRYTTKPQVWEGQTLELMLSSATSHVQKWRQCTIVDVIDDSFGQLNVRVVYVDDGNEAVVNLEAENVFWNMREKDINLSRQVESH